MMLHEAAQHLMAALEYHIAQTRPIYQSLEALEIMRQALAQVESVPSAEPKQNLTVAELTFGGRCEKHLHIKPCSMCATGLDMSHMVGPLFTAPVQPKSEAQWRTLYESREEEAHQLSEQIIKLRRDAQQAVVPHDFISHKEPWLRALQIARDSAEVMPPDIDDKAYWEHEILAFERAHNELKDLSGRDQSGNEGCAMIKTWKEQMTPNTSMGEQLVLMQAEIDALKDYVELLEPDAKYWRTAMALNWVEPGLDTKLDAAMKESKV